MTDEARNDGGEHDSPADAMPVVDVTGMALGALPIVEESDVRAAVASDDHSASEFAEMKEVVAELAWLVPQRQMNRGRSAGIRSRLVSRAAASREGRAGTPTHVPTHAVEETKPVPGLRGAHSSAPKPVATLAGAGMAQTAPRVLPLVQRRSFNWLALAGGIAFVLTVGALVRIIRDHAQFQGAVAAQQASMSRQMADLKSSMATKDSMIASLTGPQMKAVDLISDDSRDPVARMYWDQKTQEWTMYTYHLRQPAAGKIFQVWLITTASRKPISAGVFTPSANGTAIVHAKYPLDPGALRKVAVSEEPVGGMPHPTGPIIVAGAGK